MACLRVGETGEEAYDVDRLFVADLIGNHETPTSTFKPLTPEVPPMSTESEAGIYARESEFLDRYVQVGVAGSRVLSVSFPESPDEDAESELPLLDRIQAYLEGDNDDFSDIDVAMTMPTDQRSVLESVRAVPYGEQVSVKQLTRMAAGLDPEDDDDIRLVRTALSENPAPLVIPDHRVRDGPSAAPPGVEQALRSVEGL
ncbi:MAG: methylated-DNA-[protein]-cysteine S-methyltransferase [Natronomonas sp.]